MCPSILYILPEFEKFGATDVRGMSPKFRRTEVVSCSVDVGKDPSEVVSCSVDVGKDPSEVVSCSVDVGKDPSEAIINNKAKGKGLPATGLNKLMEFLVGSGPRFSCRSALQGW